MKIHPVGAELFHRDRRTDKTKLVGAFRNFANAPKNGIFNPQAMCYKVFNSQIT
jgi:hypothetical protein